MNSSFCGAKCVTRSAVVVSAMAVLLLATACGSGGGNGGGGGGGGGSFTKSSLNGQYLLSLTGIGVNQAGTAVEPFSESVVLTADGNGNLSVAVDDFDQSGLSFQLSAPPITGIYAINKNGTGVLSFNSSNYGIT